MLIETILYRQSSKTVFHFYSTSSFPSTDPLSYASHYLENLSRNPFFTRITDSTAVMASAIVDGKLTAGNGTHRGPLEGDSLNGHGEDPATGTEQHARCAPLKETLIEPKPKKATLAEALPVPKLRPALDVLNRLRYDPNFDESDHIVGYRDRHDGVQELSASLWKSDTTDEEFIPQHRIKYFKRKSDNVVVWDRFMRLDLIFGSGLKQVCSHTYYGYPTPIDSNLRIRLTVPN